MKDFFAAVEHRWPAGRKDYHWHILPDPDLVQRELFEPYRELTHQPNLAPVRSKNFHITLLHGPPVEEVTEDEIDEAVTLVREGCATVAPFDLILERPALGTVAIECIGRPGAVSRPLWQLTADATAKATKRRFPTIPAAHYPHGSIAYAVGDVKRLPLKVWLSDNGPGPVTVPVSKISLVAQWHDHREIVWDHILDVPLLG
ncbi:2'-5' RNA ligase family protein [Streptomyces viridochromogenes]|uniref:2'-5' RNA ligase family protein n=1 Tax=Streptomyces viridochromogenes TaxID=1938 RepID=UPI00065C6633|nr:2'-5' RNA ligase family protein [Streptomyces viridochromogenes]